MATNTKDETENEKEPLIPQETSAFSGEGNHRHADNKTDDTPQDKVGEGNHRHADNKTDDTPQDKVQAANRTASSPQKSTKKEGKTSRCLSFINWTALILIALCVLAGAVLSKVSLVSITGRMYSLTTLQEGYTYTLPQSVIFIQLTILLIIPDVASFTRCILAGVIGKTTESYPWPSPKALIVVSLICE